MELKDFISETLSQLIEGVVDSQKAASEHGGRVNPPVRNPTDPKSIHGRTNDGLPVALISFDVSIEVQERSGAKGGIGVATGLFNIGTAGEHNEGRRSMNRIQFSIPLALPLHRGTIQDQIDAV